MANRERGEVEIQAGGSSYTLKLDVNAMVALEDLFSTSTREMAFADIWQKVQSGQLKYVRGFLWAMLQHHHRGMTLEETGRLIDEIGSSNLGQTFTSAAMSATPDSRDVAALPKGDGKAARPRKAQGDPKDGTGAASTSQPVASA